MRADLSGVAVIFDLDGTLVDTAQDLAAAMNHALEGAGRPPVAPDKVRNLVGHGARAMLIKGFSESGETPPSEMLDQHVEAFLTYYLAHIADRSRPFPHAVEAIKQLRAAGANTAICTNKREQPARLLIEALGLSDLFETIVGMDTAPAAKPDPAPVLLCLSRTGARRGVFVGDSDTDIKAAKAARLPSLIARFGYGPVTLKDFPWAEFDSYADLPELVAQALQTT